MKIVLAAASVIVLLLAIGVHVQQQHHLQYAVWAEESAGPYNPPAIQAKSGVLPEDVTCKKQHVLAIRTDQSPICITQDTAELMVQRGGIIETVLGYTPAHQNPDNASDLSTTEKISSGAITNNSKIPVSVGNGTVSSDMVIENQGAKHADSNTITNGTGNHTRSYNGTDAGSQGSDKGHANSDAGSGANHSNTTTTTTTPPPPPPTQQYGTHQGRVSAIPASASSIVNFYLTDGDLNRAPNAAETVSTSGLLEFSINGIPIEGPDTMIETGPDTGQFYVRLQLPETINGRPLNQNDVVDVTYIDQTDRSGEQQAVTRSFGLSSTYSQINSEGTGGKRIGHEFTLRIYDPDSNTDSREENRIPLNRLEFESKGNIRVTLDHGAFDANRSHMMETGPNTGIFEVTIKIPRQIDGEIIHIGDWYKITYRDYSTPSGDAEEIVLRGKIGL